jgi:hypothetical protein
MEGILLGIDVGQLVGLLLVGSLDGVIVGIVEGVLVGYIEGKALGMQLG